MSYEQAEKFVRATMNDENLREELDDRLGSLGELDVEEARDRLGDVVPDFAEEHGYDFTAEEGFEALEALGESLDSEELSDEELEQVAGGKQGPTRAHAITLSVMTAGAYCAIESIRVAVEEDHSCSDQLSG